jgi:NAD-dependent SIR2 family protein deacetylase
MIYTVRCTQCGKEIDFERKIGDPPDVTSMPLCDCGGYFVRKFYPVYDHWKSTAGVFKYEKNLYPKGDPEYD